MALRYVIEITSCSSCSCPWRPLTYFEQPNDCVVNEYTVWAEDPSIVLAGINLAMSQSKQTWQGFNDPLSGRNTGYYMTSSDGEITVAAPCMPGMTTQEQFDQIIKDITEYQWRDRDFILASYPKTGKCISVALMESLYFVYSKNGIFVSLFHWIFENYDTFSQYPAFRWRDDRDIGFFTDFYSTH